MKLVMMGSGSYKSSLTHFRLVSLAKQLALLNFNVSVIVPSADKYNNFKPEPQAKIEHVSLIQPWQFRTHFPIINLLPYLFTSLVSLLRIRPQMVLIYKPTPITIIGLVPKILFKTPVVVDLDDLGSEVMRLEKQSKINVWLVSLCERLALRYSDAVVVASTYFKNDVITRYPHKPVLVLSNGVDADEFVVDSSSPPRNALYYFGAINRLSLVDSFLQALPATLAAVPNTQVTILGGGSALAAAQQLAADLEVSNSVTFTGWIDMHDISKHVKFADIALCTQPDIATVRAASNLKVFQYMALSSVSVVSDVGNLASYITGNTNSEKAGVAVEPDDPEALSRVLISLLKDTTSRKRMAAQARQQAETTYSWANLATNLHEFLVATIQQHSVVVAQKGIHHG